MGAPRRALSGPARPAGLCRTAARPDPEPRPAGSPHRACATSRPCSGLITSPALMAVFDLPFAPLFFCGHLRLSPWTGLLALVGGAVLIVVALANQITTRSRWRPPTPPRSSPKHWGRRSAARPRWSSALGMRGAAFDRWQIARGASLDATIGALGRRRHLHRDDPDVSPVPAVGDAGPRRLSGAAGRDDGGRDDRGLDPDGPRAGPDRDDRRPVGRVPDRAARAGSACPSCWAPCPRSSARTALPAPRRDPERRTA